MKIIFLVLAFIETMLFGAYIFGNYHPSGFGTGVLIFINILFFLQVAGEMD